jgi:hypothetical protein
MPQRVLNDRPATHRMTEKDRKLADGKGRRKGIAEKPNHAAARKPGLL